MADLIEQVVGTESEPISKGNALWGTPLHRSGRPDAIPFNSYGELVTAGAVTNHLIWPDGSTLNVPASAGVQMTLQSTSANDAAAGTGIRTVEIHYISGTDGTEKLETVELNGITGVTTTATDIRFINCMHMVTYGTGQKAAGEITATNGATTYSLISAGAVRCSSSARMVPDGYKLYIDAFYGGSVSGSAASKNTIRFFTTFLDSHDYTDDGIMIPYAGIGAQDNSDSLAGFPPFPIPAGFICGFQCDTEKASTVNAGFFGWLEPIA